MMTTHDSKPDSAFGGWLMPVVDGLDDAVGTLVEAAGWRSFSATSLGSYTHRIGNLVNHDRSSVREYDSLHGVLSLLAAVTTADDHIDGRGHRQDGASPVVIPACGAHT
jgi:hypothetical protein